MSGTENLEVEVPTQATTVVEAPLDSGEQTPDWGAIAVESVEGDTEVLEEPAEAAPVVVEAPAVAAPAGTTAATETAPATTVAPVAPVYKAPVAPVTPAPTSEEQLARLETLYRLSPEDAQAMVTEPELVLPKLLAKMHLQATQSVLNSMQTVVPDIMTSSQRAAAAETEARTAFFTVNDDLAKPEYEEALLKIGTMFRQVNPNAPREEAIQKVGELARVALGLPSKTPGATITTPAVPQPFVPARGGGAGTSTPKSKGVWEQLADELEAD